MSNSSEEKAASESRKGSRSPEIARAIKAEPEDETPTGTAAPAKSAPAMSHQAEQAQAEAARKYAEAEAARKLAAETAAKAEAERKAADDAARAEAERKATEAEAARLAAEAAALKHTVVEGETLSHISLKYYKTANRWQEIYDANKAVIGDNPNRIKIGMVLVIPTPQPSTA